MKSILLKNNKKAFTLLELVIILVCLGLIGAMVAPLFVEQHKKNVRLANQTNIKAAQAAAEVAFYDDGFTGRYTINKKDETKSFTYFRYNTSLKTIDRISVTKFEEGIPLGMQAREQAINNEVCSFIMVYVGDDNHGRIEFMTAPYYNEDGKVMIVGENPYGLSYGAKGPEYYNTDKKE